MAGTPLVLMCDSADVDGTTGACAHPVWVYQPPLIPEFDATSGIAVGGAIFLVWTTAYVIKVLRRVGD